MSLKTDIKYLLDTGKISRSKYDKMIGELWGHDKTLYEKAVKEMHDRLIFEFKDMGVKAEFVYKVIDAVAKKMKESQK